MVKYPGQGLSDDEAIEKARDEARLKLRTRDRTSSRTRSRVPVAVCVAASAPTSAFRRSRVSIRRCTDRARSSRSFWLGLSFYTKTKLVTFNGRVFDLPLLELAAFRYGCPGEGLLREGPQSLQRRPGPDGLDDELRRLAWLRGWSRLLAKLLGKPGKMDVSGDQVYEMYQAGSTRRSTTTACSTRWTPISSSCERAS